MGDWDGLYFAKRFWIEPYWKKPEFVSLLITCSGVYGQYLERCLKSVYSQTYPNIEILLIDDNTSNLPDISQYNLKYYKVDFNHANKTRNYGFSKSKGKYIVFLDADDWLYDKFVISKFVYNMKDDVSVVAGQFQKVGIEMELMSFGFPNSFDRERLFHSNYIQTTALIQRKDFLGFDEDLQQLQDWDLWVRSLLAGKKFAYLPEPVVYHYMHGENAEKCYIIKQNKRHYITPEEYKENYQKVIYKNMLLTIATSFSGKFWCFEKYFKRLSKLKFPKERTRLVFFDDSNNPKFTKLLKKKIKKIRSKYNSIVYMTGGVLPVGYEAYAVSVHIANIYNRMRPEIMKGSHCLFWEDDELPPKEVVEKLSKHLWINVGIVSAYTKSRISKKPLVWYWQNELYHAFPNSKTVEDVGAVSLGCAIIPSYMLKLVNFKPYTKKFIGHDIVFSRELANLGFRVLVDWTVKCLHFDKRGVITPKIKLHLGCGYRYMPDYINIDIENGVPKDEELDLTKELPYPDESVDLIESHHLIEHLNFSRLKYMQEFVKLFKDWHRVLRANGELIIECPDFDGLVRLYNKRPKDDLIKHFYGFGLRNNDNHYIGWNYNRLKQVLKDAGFKYILRKKARDYHARQSPCLRVEARK